MFANMDRLMAYINGPEGQTAFSRRFRVRYGTLSEYFDTLHMHVDVAKVGPAPRHARNQSPRPAIENAHT